MHCLFKGLVVYTGHDSKLMQVCSRQECGILFNVQVYQPNIQLSFYLLAFKTGYRRKSGLRDG